MSKMVNSSVFVIVVVFSEVNQCKVLEGQKRQRGSDALVTHTLTLTCTHII